MSTGTRLPPYIREFTKNAEHLYQKARKLSPADTNCKGCWVLWWDVFNSPKEWYCDKILDIQQSSCIDFAEFRDYIKDLDSTLFYVIPK